MDKPTFNLATIKGIKHAFTTLATALQAIGYSKGQDTRSTAWDGKRVDASDCTAAAAALAPLVTDTENGPRVVVEGKSDRYPGALFVAGSATTANPAGLTFRGVVASVGAGPSTVSGMPKVGSAKHIGAGINHLVRTHGGNPLPSGALVGHCQQSANRFVVLTPSDGKVLCDMAARAAAKLDNESDADTRSGLLALGVQIAADVEAFERSAGRYTPAS